MSDTMHGFADKERVFHRLWNTYGTVRFVNDHTAEVEWEGLMTADELTEALAGQLDRVPK